MADPEITQEIPQQEDKKEIDYNSLDDETFYNEYFLPEYSHVVELKRKAKEISGPFSEANFSYKNAQNDLIFERKEAENSLPARRARDNYKKSEQEYYNASRLLHRHWQEYDKEEEYMDFAERCKKDEGSLGKLYKLEQEREAKYRKAKGWLEDAVERTPEVERLKGLSKRSYREYKRLEKLKEEKEDEAYRAQAGLDKEFLKRGLKIKKEKEEAFLREKRKQWEGRDESGSSVYEEQSFDTPRLIECSTGEICFAIDYGDERMKPTEDRVLVMADYESGHTFLADIDGMGGYKDGELAAECLARSLQEDTLKGVSGQELQDDASKLMSDVGIEEGGACYAAVKIDGDELDLSKAGDVKVIIIRNGRLLYSTVDDGRFNQVSNTVRGLNSGRIKEEKMNLQEGDVVILASDGITDNLYKSGYNLVKHSQDRYHLKKELRGIEEKILETVNYNGEDLVQTVRQLGARTSFEMGRNGDGKADHRSLVVYRHGKRKSR